MRTRIHRRFAVAAAAGRWSPATSTPLRLASTASPLLPSSSPDTIFALSTAPGRAAIAVFRVSGPAAREVGERMLRPWPSSSASQPAAASGGAGGGGLSLPPLPPVPLLLPPRRAVARAIVHPQAVPPAAAAAAQPTPHRPPPPPLLLDAGLAVFFPSPRTATGEDLLELHVHGGRATVAAVSAALASLGPGPPLRVRAAAPGEFTRRAFLAGRLDLTAVEGLADLLNADTELQRRQALRQASGALSALYDAWRAELLGCLAHAEAVLDFAADEHDVDEERVMGALAPRAARLLGEMRAHLAGAERGQALREGVRVAIVGPPNAGKSSLLNHMAARPVSIVAPTPGTTRDVVEVGLDLGGLPLLLADTAGLRESPGDEVEAEGIRRALARGSAAHLRLVVVDAAELGLATSGGCVVDAAAAAVTHVPRSALPSHLLAQFPPDDEPQRAAHGGGGGDSEGDAEGGERSLLAGGAVGGDDGDGGWSPSSFSRGRRATGRGSEEGGEEGAGAGAGAGVGGGRGRQRGTTLLVLNKCDADGKAPPAPPPGDDEAKDVGRTIARDDDDGLVGAPFPTAPLGYVPAVRISCATGAGMDALLAHLRAAAGEVAWGDGGGRTKGGRTKGGVGGELAVVGYAELSGAHEETMPPPAITRARHRALVRDSAASLERFLLAVGRGGHPAAAHDATSATSTPTPRRPSRPSRPSADLAAEELRLAARSLAALTGRVEVDELLDVIFRDFCIGK